MTSFLFFIVSASAQKVSAIADRNKIVIGEQITIQIKAEDINSQNAFLQNWFYLPDTFNHMQIVKREPVDTIDINGLTTYLQKLTVTSFDSGNWKLSPMQVVMQDRITGKKTSLQTDSIILEVLPVDVSALQNYHDAKDILDVEVKPNYILYIAIGVSAIILIVLTWLFVKQFKRKKEELPKHTYKGTPLEHAMQQIRELQNENLTLKKQVKLFYIRLSNICREYFQQQLHLRSSQATSDELMVLLSVYLQNENSRSQFYQLLRLTDAVKFAKYVPDEDQNVAAADTAIISLQRINDLVHQTQNNA